MKADNKMPSRRSAMTAACLGLAFACFGLGATMGDAHATIPVADSAIPTAKVIPPTAHLPGRIPPILPPTLPLRVTNVLAEGVFHFPLQVGNRWTYEKRYPHGYETTWEVAVTGYSEGSGAVLLDEGEAAATGEEPVRGFTLEGYFPEMATVDYGPGGELVQVVSGGGTLLWYRLGTNVGTKWVSELSGGLGRCNDGGLATLASHTEFVQVPAGEFPDAVRIDYEPVCADAGIVTEWFAADFGLVKRVENSIAGPIVSELLSAQVAGMTLPDHPAASSLTLDRARILATKEPSSMTVKGAFRVNEQNTDGEEFHFQGCVSATLVLVDDSGKVRLERRIDDGGCCECKNLITLALHAQTLTLPVNFEMLDEAGLPFPEGHYSITVTLDTLDAPAVRPSATTHFHVLDAQ